MNSLYEPNSSDSSSIIWEPIICDNIDCNYPFGLACQSCTFEFELRAVAREEARHASEYGANKVASQIPVDLKSQPGGRTDDIEERVTDIVDDLQAIFAFAPPKLEESEESKKPAKLTWKNLHAQSLTPAPLKPKEQSTSSSGDNSCPGNNVTDETRVDSWLNKLVKNTLDGLLIEPPFIGGADEVDPEEPSCPYCSRSMGEGAWKELHLRNCKYAHEEAEKLEIAKAQWLKRRNC